MADPTYPLFSIFSFIAFVLALVPLPWHLEAWNAGTCMFMIWASFASLIQFVNSVVWNGNANIVSPVWCDIATKFIIGAGVGIPASTLCINRRLYSIASIHAVTVTRADRRRIVYIDLSIGVGLPVLVMILHYVVQGHRFNILEDIGCVPATFNTIAAYPLVFMWPIVLGCISFVYASLTLRAFWKRRAQFNQLLSSNGSLTMSRYFRLMLLSCLEISCTLPLSIFSVYINNKGVDLAPWVSWTDTHYNFSFIQVIPRVIWQGSRSFEISVEMSRWIFPACAFMFFALFGFAGEAQRNYRLAISSTLRLLKLDRFIRRVPFGHNQGKFAGQKPLSSNDCLPVYSPPPRFDKSVFSFSSTLKGSETDVEKSNSSLSPTKQSFALPTPPSPVYSVGDTVCADSETDRIVVSDEHPASRPPSLPQPIILPSPPPRLRPLSPPTLRSVTSLLSLNSTQETEPIVVTIHTVSHTAYEV